MYLDPGFAARNAIAAIELAEGGAYGSETILDGEGALFVAIRRRPADATIALFQGGRPEIVAVHNKAASACNFARTACHWGSKGDEALMAELKTRYNEPWMTQNAISTYGDMWVIKDALEKAGKADRIAVADALRSMDAGPSKYYPLGVVKFDSMGRRVGAGMTIVQWQDGIPVTVFPPELALAKPFWPKKA